MSYLYLNFLTNLEGGSKNRDDFYATSLNEQYEALRPRLGLYAPTTLQKFIATAFPITEQAYYVSLPGFDRRVKTSSLKKPCVNNIVVRPDNNVALASILPPNYDVILIGDVTLDNSIIYITVKGIELIDKNVAKFGERKIVCTAACAFSKKSVPNSEYPLLDYGVADRRNPVLTNDFVNALCNELYPVPNPQAAQDTFERWQKYIHFRKYYLNKQSNKYEQAKSVSVCNSYMITKEVYKRNEDSYSELLLDGIPQFARGDQVIISREVNGAASFPLIRVDIERNRKEVLSETVGRNGKGKPKFEAWLQRYTRQSMGLSHSPPNYDFVNGSIKGYFAQYLLGERYYLARVDVEPDCSALEQQHDKRLASAYEQIDTKYLGIITAKLNKYLETQKAKLEAQYDQKFKDYVAELDSTLAQNVAENKDKEINRERDRQIDQKIAIVEAKYKRQLKPLNAEIDKLNKLKEKDEHATERLAQLEQEKQAIKDSMETEKEQARQSVPLYPFYVARNAKLAESKRKSLGITMQTELKQLEKDKRSQLEVQYRESISSERNAIKRELQDKLANDKAEKIENETIRRYQIYFRPNDSGDTVDDIRDEIKAFDSVYLTYDNRAEKARIDRQEKALNSILGGYVKNPYLPSYLFAPETLAQSVREVQTEPSWLGSLNDSQKTAVRRALASESLFLLQGPPGTGKTQVIAEITAQFAKQGKKVLISSETHKAIDNVFERLPKIPEIRPLRLIPSQYGKESNYSPERLVDNFYANISGNLERQISRFEHFEETKATFDEEMKRLQSDYDRLLALKSANAKIEKERQIINSAINELNDVVQIHKDELNQVKEQIDEYRRTIKYIESYRLSTEGVKEKFIKTFATRLKKLIAKYKSISSVSPDKVGELVKADLNAIREELALLLSDDVVVKLKSRQNELHSILSGFLDPYTFNPPVEGNANYEDYKKYQSELIEVGKRLKAAENASAVDTSQSLIFALVPTIANDSALLKSLPEDLTAFKIKLQSLVVDIKADINKEMQSCLEQEASISQTIADRQREIISNRKRYEELGEDAGMAEYGELNAALRQKITRFFRDFAIVREYNTSDLQTAFDIIREEWLKLERDYKSTQQENQAKIPTYRSICKYLAQEDILEEDRQDYTRELYNCVNVFGITCTSRDKFTKAQLKDLGKYGIESVDIRSQGIDVVIIDEVSKSSFLDMLIPILYGKTVILVGDHRQLPPMYDLRHLKDDDFEDLDETIITKEINDGYTALYEECYFKTLYEKVPDDFRVMLKKQYRCHSHIMEVFNHFYGGKEKGLCIGKPQQDDEKRHNLTVKIAGNTIIDPDNHVYFIDCDKKESSAYEGSTSKINEQEAEVAIALLRELDKAANELVRTGKLRVDKDKKIDERPSIGVICTYGDQAGLIKNKRKRNVFSGFSQKQDERLIISTVDDFQGDERDIIIVSMVRNPAGKFFDAEFIKKFERINVALSRARKLLIIVGSKRFLSEEGVIDLPDLEGKEPPQLNFPVYKEIIATIYVRGKVLTASDIIGADNG